LQQHRSIDRPCRLPLVVALPGTGGRWRWGSLEEDGDALLVQVMAPRVRGAGGLYSRCPGPARSSHEPANSIGGRRVRARQVGIIWKATST
jgi:hypothetical protein